MANVAQTHVMFLTKNFIIDEFTLILKVKT